MVALMATEFANLAAAHNAGTEAVEQAERVRHSISALGLAHACARPVVSMTVSIGVVCL